MLPNGVHGHDVGLAVQGPTQEHHEVNQSFGHKAVVPVFHQRGGAVPLGKLGPVRAENHGQVAELRHRQVQRAKQLNVSRRAGQPFLRPQHVADVHGVVVHHHRHVVGGKAVGLHQHEVVGQLVLPLHVSPDDVLHRRNARLGHGEAEHGGQASGFVGGALGVA